ncbi:MAG: YdcF family protein [Pseudomonadota bacterium]
MSEGGAVLAKPLAIAFAAIAVVWLAGFGAFLAALPQAGRDEVVRADALVVVTGGQGSRIRAGMALLSDGAGRRLMISGVGRDVTDKQIMEIAEADPTLFDCCVDLGRDAESTVGNAKEIGAWAEGHGFSTLIVVTSDYHMPRTLMLLRDRLPSVELVASPVPARWGARSFAWLAPKTVAKLAHEYNKLLATSVRLRLVP